MSFKVTRLGPPRIRRDTIVVGDVVFTSDDIGATAHIADTSDAHDASAVSVLDTGGNFTGTDVEAALAELAAGGGAAVHIADATDAHDASAISVLDTAANFTGTDVEAVLAELVGMGGGGGVTLTPETPAGTINSINDTFTLSVAPDLLILFKNGLVQREGSGNDYVLTGSTIVYEAGNIPQTGDTHIAYINDSITGEILDHTTAEMDDTLVLAPDGAGGVEFRAEAGGGGSSTIQYGGLKPATPLDDFDGTSLDGAWSANSSQGTFATTDCYTQAVDGSHLSMGFQAKNGRLYRAATDVDQEWLAGGMMPHGQLLDLAQEPMFGIALLNTSGTGVGIVVYDDSNAYLASITTWGYGAQTGSFSGYGHNLLQHGPYAMRITRVGNVFTGYISIDGQAWVAASATITSAFTVGYKAVGLFYNPAQAYKGRLFVDWVHTV